MTARLAAPMPPLPPQPAGVPWPVDAWPEARLGSDVDADAVERVVRALVTEPDPERTGHTHALVFVHRGRIVREAYGTGEDGTRYDAGSTLISWSMAKSVTHALVGLLVRDGKLDVDAPAPVPAWRERGDPRRDITLEHLLRMCDGLDFVEVYEETGRSDVVEMLFRSGRDDVAAFAEARPLAHPPGTYWSYSSGTSNVVAAIVARTVGGGEAGMRAFMQRELFDRVGMRSATARFDAAGNFIGSSYVFATARDFARFGLLYLRDGVFDGERVLPNGWVDHARSLAVPSFDQYGAHWWLAQDGSGIFHASGFRGQYIVVVPTRDLVVVRLGNSLEERRPAVVHLLKDAVEAFPLV